MEEKHMITFFSHIPKAGGTTLKQIFYKAFGQQGCIKVWPNFGADVDVEGFKGLEESSFREISAVVGHLPVGSFMENRFGESLFEKGGVDIITSVRHPFERIVSLYNYLYYNAEHPHHEEMKKTPLGNFVKYQPGNYQFEYLKTDCFDSPKKILEKFKVFSMENSIDGFKEYFAEKHNLIMGNVEVQNTSKTHAGAGRLFKVEDIPKEILLELEKKHEIDLELYEGAKK
ncbi:sulfotransferase family 2 domain-containing protein [uncultured Desulfuromonas sp.]|uniref:sulfotransferase family 2 domain-containing protein n=1 Tax=uncultured Desulfuromonas sp. TaxID=181013 RepID=UPI002625B230|nr:sulfotransferase family 2 domain-containing protein [uncultured Desulfuromonas sp.]